MQPVLDVPTRSAPRPPTAGTRAPALAGTAQRLALDLLAHDPARRRHSSAVAARAGEGAGTLVPALRSVVVAAAWLHDVGYAPALRVTGFHPLDGARHLRAHGWPHPVPTLVAHHSGARFVAPAHDLADALAEFPLDGPEDDERRDREDGDGTGVVPGSRLRDAADVLTWADQTTGPRGGPVTLDERLDDMLRRHGPDSPNARVHRERAAHLRAAVARVEVRRRRLAATTP